MYNTSQITQEFEAEDLVNTLMFTVAKMVRVSTNKNSDQAPPSLQSCTSEHAPLSTKLRPLCTTVKTSPWV